MATTRFEEISPKALFEDDPSELSYGDFKVGFRNLGAGALWDCLEGYNGGFSLGKQSEMEDGIPDYLPSSAVAYRSIHRSRSYRTASLIIGD